jgi:hypothetical protein
LKIDIKNKCAVAGCDRDALIKGLCGKHYQRQRTHNDVNHNERVPHGLIDSSEYNSWCSMKARCNNKNSNRYHNYGGRGITVCDSWMKSFITFYNDMGKKPDPSYQIERINNDGNYEPLNCKWATPAENSQNRSTTILSMEKAKEIRNRYKKGGVSQYKLAEEYGCNRVMIAHVVRNMAWQ